MAEIEVEGIEKLSRAIEAAGRDVLQAAQDGLRAGGLDIIADAQETLRRENINTKGALSQSGHVQEDRSDPLSMDVGFFSKTRGEGYAVYVEYGRKSGKMPPVDTLFQWLKTKHRRSNKELSALRAASAFTHKPQKVLLTSAAWAISKSIAKHGTKPHPFFKPAVERNTRKLLQAIYNAEQEVLR